MRNAINENPDHFFRLSRQHKQILLAILLVAFGVRLLAILFFPADVIADASDYHRLATDVSRGLGYVNEAGLPTAWRPPGYPFFLAGIYFVAGPNVFAATVVQVLLGTGTVLLIVWLASLFVSSRVALLSGAIAAVYPPFFWLPRLLLSENVALFLIVAALIAATRLVRSGKTVEAIALGVILGMATLVRGATLPIAVLLLAGIALGSWRRNKELRARLQPALIALVAFVITLAPWVVRNYVVFDRLVLTTQEGFGFYASYWPPEVNGKRIWGNLPGNEDPVVAAASRGNEVVASEYLSNETKRRLIEDPGRIVKLLPEKLISLAAPFDWEVFPHRAGSSRSFNWAYLFVLPFAFAGAWLLWRRRIADQWLLWVVPVSVLIQSVIFYGSPRFRLPAELVAIVMAAVAIWAIESRFSHRTVRAGSGALAGR